MKIRGLIVAALVLLALAGILYWSEHHKPDDTAKAATAAPPAILKLDEASIIKLEIKKNRDSAAASFKRGFGGLANH